MRTFAPANTTKAASAMNVEENVQSFGRVTESARVKDAAHLSRTPETCRARMNVSARRGKLLLLSRESKAMRIPTRRIRKATINRLGVGPNPSLSAAKRLFGSSIHARTCSSPIAVSIAIGMTKTSVRVMLICTSAEAAGEISKAIRIERYAARRRFRKA